MKKAIIITTIFLFFIISEIAVALIITQNNQTIQSPNCVIDRTTKCDLETCNAIILRSKSEIDRTRFCFEGNNMRLEVCS